MRLEGQCGAPPVTSLTFSEGGPGLAAHCLSLNAGVDICNKVTHSGESVCVYIEIKSDPERRARNSFTESHPNQKLPSGAGEQVLPQGVKDLRVGDLLRSPDWTQTVPNLALAMAPHPPCSFPSSPGQSQISSVSGSGNTPVIAPSSC